MDMTHEPANYVATLEAHIRLIAAAANNPEMHIGGRVGEVTALDRIRGIAAEAVATMTAMPQRGKTYGQVFYESFPGRHVKWPDSRLANARPLFESAAAAVIEAAESAGAGHTLGAVGHTAYFGGDADAWKLQADRDTWEKAAVNVLEHRKELLGESDLKAAYDAAMQASNAAGFVGIDPAGTIEWQAEELDSSRAIIAEVHSWAVCAAITDAEGMMQNIGRIVEVTAPGFDAKAALAATSGLNADSQSAGFVLAFPNATDAEAEELIQTLKQGGNAVLRVEGPLEVATLQQVVRQAGLDAGDLSP